MSVKRNIRGAIFIIALLLLSSLFSFAAGVDVHEHKYIDGQCECGAIVPHKHNFIDGKCVCGVVDEDYMPPREYFVGNVFQIEVQSLGEQLISVGSGFVLNRDGWFITNSHVMEDAYYANALFEIPNAEQGNSFTKLSITQAGFNNPNKDFFIGKIDNYTSIAEYYKDIDFSTEYELGEVTYSVGYPSATPYMRINKGVVVDNSTSFEGKLNGVQYVASSSYIMQGSSGGVLLNSDLDVIGITTIVRTVNGEFDRSFSVSTFNFQNDVEKVPNYELNSLTTFMHPDEVDYIRFFNALKNKTGLERTEELDGVTSYSFLYNEEGMNDEELAYSRSEMLTFDSDFYMCVNTDIYWANGDRREINLFGYWSPFVGFDNFIFEFKYTLANGQYYTVKSTNINYSTNIYLTLNDYTTDSSFTYTISEEDIMYAREQFNNVYEMLLTVWMIE